ncbi:MAG: hypothetical protein R3F59_13895 [Myxococcota bacterium]
MERASWPDQRVTRCAVDGLEGAARGRGARGEVVLGRTVAALEAGQAASVA